MVYYVFCPHIVSSLTEFIRENSPFCLTRAITRTVVIFGEHEFASRILFRMRLGGYLEKTSSAISSLRVGESHSFRDLFYQNSL